MDNVTTLRKLYLRCRERGITVDGHTAAIAIRAAGDYAGIREGYYGVIVDALIRYLTGEAGRLQAKNFVKKEMLTAFTDAFETGWVETGGDPYEPEPEDSEWLTTRMNQELAYIDGLFVTMSAMLSDTEEPLTLSDIDQYAEARASGYAATLDGVYAQGKLRGKKNVMLTFGGPDGSPDNICQKNGGTCVKLKDKRHRAKWWIGHDLIPGPGNENYDCGGYNCQHYLEDDSGNRWAGTQG